MNLAITDTRCAGEPGGVQKRRGDEACSRADGARRRERRTGYSSRSGEVGAGRGDNWHPVSGQLKCSLSQSEANASFQPCTHLLNIVAMVQNASQMGFGGRKGEGRESLRRRSGKKCESKRELLVSCGCFGFSAWGGNNDGLRHQPWRLLSLLSFWRPSFPSFPLCFSFLPRDPAPLYNRTPHYDEPTSAKGADQRVLFPDPPAVCLLSASFLIFSFPRPWHLTHVIL